LFKGEIGNWAGGVVDIECARTKRPNCREIKHELERAAMAELNIETSPAIWLED
jgi:hypothetical protein